MSPVVPREFPNAVCWDPSTRAQVMNTIALDVRPSVFRATHFPSFLQQEGAAPGAYAPVSEEAFLEDFLRDDHPHVFNVAVGDSGVGKSHLVRWMLHEIQRRNETNGQRWWVVEVPRSSANLADVVRRILRGFDGETVSRLKRELERAHDISVAGATTRVLDELAYVLERACADGRWANDTPNDIDADILRLLPSLLRAAELRRALIGRHSRIVPNLAKHVLGHRDRREDREADLRWTPADLAFTPSEFRGVGGEAGELAALFMADDAARETGAGFLNRALPDALRNLLRFRKGDMKAAIAEIRGALLSQGKELILLIEDLSVTEGLDAELIEGLQVRTRDTGEELCRLRSVVGVTHDDYAQMRENIKVGRTLRTVYFNVPLSPDEQGTPGTVGHLAIRDFASRYLNAARYTVAGLDAWAADEREHVLPSACEWCPNRTECHEAFGAVDGRGLYPLSPESLERLYTNVSGGIGAKAFNPRLLVGRVLSGVLEEGERTIPSGDFPSPSIAAAFKLNAVRADVQIQLRNRFGSKADRLQRALDLYATDPSAPSPRLRSGIVAAFALAADSVVTTEEAPSPAVITAPPQTPTPGAVVTELDLYDRWLRRNSLPDRELNRWRSRVHEAVMARIEDSEGLAPVLSRFKASQITFDGQHTQARGDAMLHIARSPETAVAMRALVEGLDGIGVAEAEQALIQVRRKSDAWTCTVREHLHKHLEEPGDPAPVELAIELLVLGARLCGRNGQQEPELLAAAFQTWPTDEPAQRSAPWLSLWRAFQKEHENIRKLARDTLACTKGGRAGAMIDPTPVVGALRRALVQETPCVRPPESTSWNTYRDVNRLADEVERHLARAIESEIEACRAWCATVESLAGDTPADTTSSVRRAFDAAAAQAQLELPRDSDLGLRLHALSQSAIGETVRTVKRLLTETDRAMRLSTLGSVDRVLMSTTERTLREAGAALDASIARVNNKLAALSQGQPPGAVEVDIKRLFAELQEHLRVLEGNANND